VHRRRARAVRASPGTARTVLRAVSRRQLGQNAGRKPDPAGASHRLSDLPAGMAGGRFIGAAVARLHERGAGRTVRLWLAGTGRSRTLPDVALARHGGRDAGGTAVIRRSPKGEAVTSGRCTTGRRKAVSLSVAA